MTFYQLPVCNSHEESTASPTIFTRRLAAVTPLGTFAFWGPSLALALRVVGLDGGRSQGASDDAIIVRRAYSDCVGGGAMTTAAALQCAHDEFEFQDKRLNQVYQALMSRISVEQKIALRNEERQWLASRRKKCALPIDAGTADQVSSADCEVAETAQRATFLESRLQR